MNFLNKNSIDKISKKESKNYLHFDRKLSNKLKKRKDFFNKIDYKSLKEHRYLPFIRIKIKFQKYYVENNKKKIKNKIRPITLPSHNDAEIYRYFGEILNNLYNSFAKHNCIDNSSVAYRTNNHDSNIEISKKVFDYITNKDECWILKGDFKHFFDKINHKVLKQNVKKIIENNWNEAWYRMLKAITKYKFINKKTLLKQLGKIGIDKNINTYKAYFKNIKQFNTLIKSKDIRLSPKNNVGIPQGTPISGVLANVYAAEFDKWIESIIVKNNGLYKRYSDDFIIIIPKNNRFISFKDIEQFFNLIDQKSKSMLKMCINNSKTQILKFNKSKNEIINSNNNHRILDYLGFSFDGKTVSIRSKSLYKFYYKGNHEINYYYNGLNSSTINQKHYIHKQLSIRYLTTNVKQPRSSMMYYIKKSQKIFESNNPIYNVKIYRQSLKVIKHNQRTIHYKRKFLKTKD